MRVDIVVGDDLTGVADTLVQFTGGAARVVVFPSLHRFERAVRTGTFPHESLAIGVNTESRHLGSAEAAKRVARAHTAALKLRPRLLFQRVDSALRGNPGAELSAYRAVTGERIVVVSPAFLASGRTVRNGILFVHGLPLALSGVASDLRTPMMDSSVVDILQQQTDTAVRLLRPGAESIAGGLPGIVVADAGTEADLAALAVLVIADGLLRAVAGSAGLAAELSRALDGSTAVARSPRLQAAKTLAIFGSPHPNAAQQLEIAAARYDRSIHRPAVVGDRSRRDTLVVEAAESDLHAAGVAFIGSPPRTDAVSVLPHVVASRLARTAAQLAGRPSIDSLVLSGGDIAAAVCAALSVERIELTGQVFPGAPLGVIRGGSADGVLLATKSGAHGDAQGLLTILTALRGPLGKVPAGADGAREAEGR